MIGKLLSRSLPSHWLDTDVTTVEWIAGQRSQPPNGWLELLWNYLRTNCPQDLRDVETFPLIPVRSPRKQMVSGLGVTTVTELVPLSSRRGALLIRRADGISLGSELESIATKIGLTVVDTPPDYIHGHVIVERDYLFAPTYMGVLRAVQRQCERDGRARISALIESLTAQEKRRLRELFAKISAHELHDEYHDLLSHLPLFETLDGSGSQPSHFVSAAQVALAAPAERMCIAVSHDLLDVSSADCQTLANLLSVRRLDAAQMLTEVVFADIESGFHDSASVRRIMLYVMRNYHRLLSEADSQFQLTLRSLAFVERKGTLMPADRFYDPADDLLRRIFVLQDNFPPSPYTDAASLSVLRDLGLRGIDDVDAADVREAALFIAQMSQEKASVDRLCDKSAAIVDYIERYPDQLSVDSGGGVRLGEALAEIAWARRSTARPTFYPSLLTWYSDPQPFYRPSDMAPRSLASAVGSVKPVAIADVSEPVQRSFGWNEAVPVDSVLDHLVNTIASYNGRDKALYAEIVRSTYAELMRHVVDGDFSVVFDGLQQRSVGSWIWHGDGFASADHVVFVPPSFVDLRPFVYGLASEMLPYSDLLSGAGVRQTARLTDVLSKVRQKHDNCLCPQQQQQQQMPVAKSPSPWQSVASAGSVDVKRDLHICISVLNELKSQILAGCCESDLSTLQSELCLPVQTEDRSVLKLAPIAECTYCDEEWLRQGASSENTVTLNSYSAVFLSSNTPNLNCCIISHMLFFLFLFCLFFCFFPFLFPYCNGYIDKLLCLCLVAL